MSEQKAPYGWIVKNRKMHPATKEEHEEYIKYVESKYEKSGIWGYIAFPVFALVVFLIVAYYIK